MVLVLLRRPAAVAVGLGFTSAFALRPRVAGKLLRCEPPDQASAPFHGRDAKVPVIKGGRINPAAYRQISSGSVLGLLTGVAVSTFSKTLAFMIGLTLWGVQYLQSKGIQVIPTAWLQRQVKGANVRSLVEDNAAFKLSFAAAFMLSTFAEL